MRPAFSTSSALGAKVGVARLDLARVDERLAVEAELAALLALGEEAGLVLDVVVDAVEDHLAGGPGGEQAEAEAGSSGWRPGTCSAWSSLARSLVPITSTARRSDDAAISSALQHGDRRLEHRPDLRVVGRAAGLEAPSRSGGTSSARVDLRDDDRGRARPWRWRARSSSCHWVPMPLARMAISRLP